jgi:hypothetical protein
VHEDAVERARERLAGAAAGRPTPADVDAVLDRARGQLEALAQSTAELEGALPARIGDAVREGVRSEAQPVARQLAEVRGVSQQTIRRLEGIELELRAERYSRVDDLDLLVELITSSWRNLAERLDRIERTLEAGSSATVHHLEDRRAGA